MIRFFKKIKWWQLILIVIALMAIGFFLMYFAIKNGYDIPVLIIVFLIFICISIFTQELVSRAVNRKFNKKPKYIRKYFNNNLENIDSLLKKAKFEVQNLDFGTKYNLVIGTVLYKIMIIKDSSKYFDNNIEMSPAKNINKAKTMISLELFVSNDKELVNKIEGFSFQTEKLFYTSMYVDLEIDKIVWPNVVEANEKHSVNVEYIFNLLNLKESE